MPDDETWVVRIEGGGLVDRAFTKEIAVEAARKRASVSRGRLIVHRADGTVEREVDYAERAG